jgi:LysR family transcriptional regulator, cys regulon transcriptional activator
MKLQQLRYLAAIVESDLNITAAAERLHTSQPGVSKQLKQLEDELGFPIFLRQGRTLTRVTPAGKRVIDRALKVLKEVQSIKRLAEEQKGDGRGSLAIGTTHTQARYVLPEVIRKFRERYPQVELHLHQGTSEQIADMSQRDRIDFAINTGSQEMFGNLVLLPCYRWHRRIVVPHGHPLAQLQTREAKITIETLAEYPIVTYVFGFSGPSSLQQIFARAGVTPRVALTARDADVIKTYVRLGLGVGIVASMALDPREDGDLVAIDASHLFPAHMTWAGFQQGALLRGYMYDFLQVLAPHLARRLVDRAGNAPTPADVEALFADVALPVYR